MRIEVEGVGENDGVWCRASCMLAAFVGCGRLIGVHIHVCMLYRLLLPQLVLGLVNSCFFGLARLVGVSCRPTDELRADR